MINRIRLAFACLLFAFVAPAHAVPQPAQTVETAPIPFDPPLGEPLRYRWERSVQQDGKTALSWSVDDMTFEKADDGYRLTVTPVSSGSNEQDPRKLAFMKMLEDLTRAPFVVRISEEAEIVGIEREQEYWDRITSALRGVLAKDIKEPEQVKAIERFVAMFENMPAEARRAQLTEQIQPLVEFALTETTTAKPIITEVETASPFGGTIKREVAITLNRVENGTAHLTIRVRVPGAEAERLTKQLVDGVIGERKLTSEQAAGREAGLAVVRQMKTEGVADYKISLADGMLEAFETIETISLVDEGKKRQRITTKSLKLVE